MPSPSGASVTSNIADSGIKNIDALLSGYKWGGGLGVAANVSYSFPWINGLAAIFSGPNGTNYSSNNEQTASQHFGLNSTEQAAAIAALTAWSNVANINFQRVTESDTSVGDIRFAFSSASSLNSWWGYASFPSNYWSKGGDIWINAKYGADTNWASGSYNFSALMHEIGHSLGLEHPFSGNVTLTSEFDSTQYTLMSYTDGPYTLFGQIINNANGTHTWLTRNINPETPMLLDIAVMQYLYGANNTYKTGDDTYTFDPKTPFLKTIWDAGGNDTISVANFSLGCEINLNPGAFSKVSIPSDSTAAYNWTSPPTVATYDGTNNLAIAYNCIIENAVGGSGNDKLTGNSADNHLDGGPGNDIMYGVDGNDTFDWDATKRSGNDTFYGGKGNDVFVLDNTNDQVIEYANEGTDTVWVNFSYSLSNLPNVENLYCFGSSAYSISGNSNDNFLEGGNGDDTIDGGSGTDTVFFEDKLADCAISVSGTGYSIKTKTQGTDTVKNAEILSFSDQTLDLTKLNFPPTISLKVDKTNITLGQSVVISFTLSDFSNTFTQSDISVSSGSISGFTGNGTSYAATYTPDNKSIGSVEISVASGAFANAVGRMNEDGSETNNKISLTVASAPSTSVTGTAFNDLWTSTAGDDVVNGLGGIDTMVFSGAFSNYSIMYNSYLDIFTINDKRANGDGKDTLSKIERLKFSDTNLALDINGNAGITAKILGAVFGKDSIHNKPYVGIGLSLLDNGMPYDKLGALALQATGVQTNDQIVNLLWTNVVGSHPTTNDAAPFIALLKNGMTPGELVQLAADTPLNTGNINLVGLIQTGIEFIPA